MPVSDIQVFAASALSCFAVLTWFGIAAFLHRKRRAAIPVRIHVAGSRGKTTTARLIGAALRGDGRRVLVKTTGTDPLLILPDGGERPWPRWGPPTIAEQMRFFREAARLKVDAVVLESMAIEPEYLWASERYFVRATHAVITNVRPDHAESLGDMPQAMAEATSLVVPRNGRLFVADEAAVEPILSSAVRQATEVHIVPVAGLEPAAANRKLALSVCTSLGISEEIALPAFARVGEDPGSFFVADAEIAGIPIRFANAFACNDATSFRQLWAAHATKEPAIIFLNARRDRPLRTRAFLKTLAALDPLSMLFLSGGVLKSWVREAGFAPERTRWLRGRDAGNALADLARAAGPGATIWGVGNYSGLGARMVAQLRQGGPAC